MVKFLFHFFHELGLFSVLVFKVFDKTDCLDVMETVEMGLLALAHFKTANEGVVFAILREAHEDGFTSMRAFGFVEI